MHTKPLTAFVAFLLAAPTTWAQPCDTQPPIELLSSNGIGYARAGFAVAAADDIVVVGAYGDENNLVGAGSAKVYRLIGGVWVEEAELLPPVPAVGDWFGYSVDTDGERIVVGVPYGPAGAINRAGHVIVFRNEPGTGWVFEARLEDATFEDEFGYSVAIDEDRILVGAPGFGPPNSEVGRVLVYERSGTTWDFEQILQVPAGDTRARAGHSVALDMPFAIIGAPGDDSVFGTPDGGAAFAYEYTGLGWSTITELTPIIAAADGAFGWSVAVDSGTAVVGSPDRFSNTDYSGLASVFTYDSGAWPQSSSIPPAYGTASGDHFGEAVAILGDQMVIGATGRDYIAGYTRVGSNWQLNTSNLFDPPGIQTRSEFGTAIAISDLAIIVGAESTDVPETNTGSAFVYPNGCPCPGDFDQNGSANFFDFSSYIAAYNDAYPGADLAEPFGTFNFFDISAFVTNYQAGCP